MPVIMPAVPDNIRAAFLSGVADFLWHEKRLLEELRGHHGNVEGLSLHTFTIRDVLPGNPGVKPNNIGWRVFALLPTAAVAGDVLLKPRAAPRLSNVTWGPELKESISIMKGILTRQEFQGGHTYNLKLLRIPSTLVESCWLDSGSPATDVYIPILSGLTLLSAGSRYESQLLFDEAKKFAERL